MIDCEAARKTVREHLQSLVDPKKIINMEPLNWKALELAKKHLFDCLDPECMAMWQELHGTLLKVGGDTEEAKLVVWQQMEPGVDY